MIDFITEKEPHYSQITRPPLSPHDVAGSPDFCSGVQEMELLRTSKRVNCGMCQEQTLTSLAVSLAIFLRDRSTPALCEGCTAWAACLAQLHLLRKTCAPSIFQQSFVRCPTTQGAKRATPRAERDRQPVGTEQGCRAFGRSKGVKREEIQKGKGTGMGRHS